MARTATRTLYDNLQKALQALQDAGEAPKTGYQREGWQGQFVAGNTHNVSRDNEGNWYVSKP